VWFEDAAGIGRVKGDGTHVQRNFVPLPREYGGGVVEGLASDGRYLYFSRCQDATIGRVRLNGKDREMNFVQLTPHSDCPQSLAVGNGSLYWTNPGLDGPGWIGRVRLNGSQVNSPWEVTSDDPLGPFDVAAGEGYVFWTRLTPAEGPTYMGRVQKDGSGYVDVWQESPATKEIGPLAIDP
jgi:hypothetical protein